MADINKAQASEEANEKQLQLANAQGDAYQYALQEMAFREADDGRQKQVGDYMVAYAIEEAEGMYMPTDSGLEWHNPTDENAHVEISVSDAVDGRFVPHLTVKVTLFDDQDKELGTQEQPFMWHSWLYHYGRNWKVPSSGKYKLKVQIEAPAFHRHDKVNGRRFGEDVELTFDNVKIQTGQKKA